MQTVFHNGNITQPYHTNAGKQKCLLSLPATHHSAKKYSKRRLLQKKKKE